MARVRADVLASQLLVSANSSNKLHYSWQPLNVSITQPALTKVTLRAINNVINSEWPF